MLPGGSEPVKPNVKAEFTPKNKSMNWEQPLAKKQSQYWEHPSAGHKINRIK
jgi:hypothetical protein